MEFHLSLIIADFFTAGKLASLEEFRVQKEKLMAERENLEQTIVNLKEDHKEVIYQLERKQVVDKDRLASLEIKQLFINTI